MLPSGLMLDSTHSASMKEAVPVKPSRGSVLTPIRTPRSFIYSCRLWHTMLCELGLPITCEGPQRDHAKSGEPRALGV